MNITLTKNEIFIRDNMFDKEMNKLKPLIKQAKKMKRLDESVIDKTQATISKYKSMKGLEFTYTIKNSDPNSSQDEMKISKSLLQIIENNIKYQKRI